MAFSPQQQKITVVVVLVLVFVILVGLAFYLIEWETKEVNTGYSDEARKNPFLAAELFLDKYEIKSERSIRFTLLNSVQSNSQSDDEEHIAINDTLVLINSRGMIRGKRFEKIWQWLENGGNLIITTANPFIGKLDQEDDLFQSLGIRVVGFQLDESDFLKDDEVEVSEETETLEETSEDELAPEEEGFVFSDTGICDYAEAQSFSFPGEEENLQVSFEAYRSIQFGDVSPEWILQPAIGKGVIAAGFSIGDGRVSVIPNARHWRNTFIQCYDHAYLLQRLAEGSRKVWFLENRDAPSLISYMFQYIPYAALAFLLLIVMSIWGYNTRFGPVFIRKSTARRSFAEHIHASANFLWKHSEYEKLIKELRDNVYHSMQRKVLAFERKSHDEQLELLAKYSRMQIEELRDPLFKARVESLNEFVEFVRILKNVRDNL